MLQQALTKTKNPMAFDLLSLPSEIVSHIFSYLSLEDRGNVKLTSHLCYRCAIVPSIIRSEKLVFRHADNFESEEMARSLVELNYSQLNLAFDDVLISRIPAHTWEICGPKINSLSFHFAEYKWDFDTILNIIERSVNLAELEMRILSQKVRSVPCIPTILCEDHSGTDCMMKLLDKLAERRIERRNLHTLVLVISYDIFLKNELLKNLFSIFPCIKHFSLEILQRWTLSKSPLKLDQYLSPSLPLESIVFKVLTKGDWIKESIMKPEWASRLTNFETHCLVPSPCFNYESGMLLEFFENQRNLTAIKLNIVSRASNKEYSKNLIFHILESCSCLKDLQFKFTETMEILLNQNELSNFLILISKLRCLSLNNIAFGSHLCSEHVLPTLQSKNFAMSKLVLDCVGGIDEEFCSIIIQCCPRLKYLEVFAGVNKRLQNIFQYLINLKTLILRIPKKSGLVSDDGFCGYKTGGYSIKRLQKLERLKIKGYYNNAGRCVDAEFTARIIHELQFPKLKLLELDFDLFSGKLVGTDLIHLTSNVPGVEKFGITGMQHLDEVVKICSYFKHLTHLHIEIVSEKAISVVFDLDEKDFFEMFPRLRFIIYHEQSYHINRMTKRTSCMWRPRPINKRTILSGYSFL